jgi:DNA invertase Pin-like site-specific DNA recombinase
MRAVIYVRRSTDEHQADSLQVQEGEAKKFIKRKGWTLAPSYLYSDDAVSRAEFKKRPALLRLLNDAQAKAFDVVVVRDETRLGGEVFQTGLLIQTIRDAGARLYYYFTDEEVVLDNAHAKIMVALRNFASELEREKISQRTREHLMTKAQRGLNVGGRCYGYDNVEVKDGDRRLRVEYRNNPEQARVVREVFVRYGKGDGLRSIVKDLNRRHVPPPSAGERGTGSWSIGALWAMLRRERYRGVLVWGKYEKTYKQGTKVRVPRDPSEWTRVEVPDLRIISDEEWFGVQNQIRKVNRTKTGGRPHRYLLSGIGRCGACGGPMTVINGRVSYEVTKVYCCGYHRERGVCSNSLRRPVETVDATVIGWLMREVIDERFVLLAIKELRRRFATRAREAKTEAPGLERETAKLRREVARLVTAIAMTEDKPEPMVTAIAERQKRLTSVEAELRNARETPTMIGKELDRVEAEARKRLEQFERFLSDKGEAGRRVVAAAFVGPIKMTAVDLPEGRRFKLEGEARIGKLLAMEGEVSNVASPAGHARKGYAIPAPQAAA